MFSKLHYDLTSFFQHFYVIMELLKVLFNFKTDITYDQQLNAEYLRCWSFFCIARLLPRKIFTKNFFAHFDFFEHARLPLDNYRHIASYEPKTQNPLRS